MFDRRFYLALAVCSFFAAIGPMLSYGLSFTHPQPASWEELVALHSSTAYMARQWIVLTQVFMMFLALGGLAAKKLSTRPSLAVSAFVFLFFWEILELLPRSIELFAVNLHLAPSYFSATTDAARTMYETNIRALDSIIDAFAYPRPYFWMVTHLLLGFALWGKNRLEKTLAIVMFLNFGRLLLAQGLRPLGDFSFLFVIDPYTFFVILMVIQFTLLGYWLWKDTLLNQAAEGGRSNTSG
jgi:hypothetical protein